MPAAGAPGLPWPEGNPEAVHSAAATLRREAQGVGHVIDDYGPRVRATLAGWQGSAAQTFGGSSQMVHKGLEAVGDTAAHAAQILTEYADALQRGQDQAHAAGADLAAAGATYRSTVIAATAVMAAAASPTATLTLAQTQFQAAEIAAFSTLHGATTAAHQRAEEACHDAAQAARLATAKINHLAEDAKGFTLKEFLDKMAGPGAAQTLLGLPLIGKSGANYLRTIAALRSGNLQRLAALDPTKWSREVQVIANQSGDTSLAALGAKMRFEEGLGQAAGTDLRSATTSLAEIPAGKIMSTLDVLGKGAMALSVLADGYTLYDPHASARDKWLAGGNLAGAGAAALGTDAAASVLGALGAADLATSWIPVAGEVMFAVTGAVMAGIWLHDHWAGVEHVAGDVGHAFVSAGDWVFDKGAGLATGAVHTLGSLGSKAEHAVAGVLSDLNPF